MKVIERVTIVRNTISTSVQFHPSPTGPYTCAAPYTQLCCFTRQLRCLDLHMNPRRAAFPFDEHLIYIRILFQYVKEHFCIVEVVAVYVGSLALQVSGIGYAPDSGVQSFRAVPAIDIHGLPDGVS